MKKNMCSVSKLSLAAVQCTWILISINFARELRSFERKMEEQFTIHFINELFIDEHEVNAKLGVSNWNSL